MLVGLTGKPLTVIAVTSFSFFKQQIRGHYGSTSEHVVRDAHPAKQAKRTDMTGISAREAGADDRRAPRHRPGHHGGVRRRGMPLPELTDEAFDRTISVNPRGILVDAELNLRGCDV